MARIAQAKKDLKEKGIESIVSVAESAKRAPADILWTREMNQTQDTKPGHLIYCKNRHSCTMIA